MKQFDSSIQKVIYDVGSNNGDDIPYYLMKADVVVAIEANPALCEVILHRFASEIQTGRLILENCVVTADQQDDEVDFYIHKSNHVLSQLPPPPKSIVNQFTKVRLPSKSILDIVKIYGNPYYIKIDIEHYDAPLLRALFSNGIRPPFISAESHSIEVFSILVSEGLYNSFKLVDGSSVARVYSNCWIRNEITNKCVQYSFPFHSAGPFGNDIDGEWMTGDIFFRLLAFKGLGWKDIHATNQEHPNVPTSRSARSNFMRHIRNNLKIKLARLLD